jgi:hypothetical protein
MPSKKKYTIRKYDGDDCYSWAVFRKADIPKGRRGILFYGEATPIVCGFSKPEAEHYRDLYERRDSNE